MMVEYFLRQLRWPPPLYGISYFNRVFFFNFKLDFGSFFQCSIKTITYACILLIIVSQTINLKRSMNALVLTSSLLSILTFDLRAARRGSRTPGPGPNNLVFRAQVQVWVLKNWTRSKYGRESFWVFMGKS